MVVWRKALEQCFELPVKLVIYFFHGTLFFFKFERMTYLKELKFSHDSFPLRKDFSDVISADINYVIFKYSIMRCANIRKICIT